MILAAGLGTRLRPLTNKLPKALIPINNRTLIEHTLLLLQKFNIKEVVINLHHLSEEIRSALGSGSRWNLQITYSDEPEILGTGGGIKKVQSILSGDTFLLINGDILVDLDLGELSDFHKEKGGAVTMVLREVSDPEAWGCIKIDSDDRVRQIRTLPQDFGEGMRLRMFAGIHIIEPRLFHYLPPPGFSNLMDTYVEMILKGEDIRGYTMKGYWADIGTPERYEAVKADFLQERVKLSYLERS